MKPAKLHINELNKTFTINHTNKNIRKSYRFQLIMARLGKLNDLDDMNDQMTALADYSDTLVEFPTDVLKLNDKQKAIIDDMDQDKLQELDVTLALKIQGMNGAQIAEVIKTMRDDNSSANSKSKK